MAVIYTFFNFWRRTVSVPHGNACFPSFLLFVRTPIPSFSNLIFSLLFFLSKSPEFEVLFAICGADISIIFLSTPSSFQACWTVTGRPNPDFLPLPRCGSFTFPLLVQNALFVALGALRLQSLLLFPLFTRRKSDGHDSFLWCSEPVSLSSLFKRPRTLDNFRLLSVSFDSQYPMGSFSSFPRPRAESSLPSPPF